MDQTTSANPAQWQSIIEQAWNQRERLSPDDRDLRRTIDAILQALDDGVLRVAEKTETGWVTHGWLKMAVLLSFRLFDNGIVESGALYRHLPRQGPAPWFDKVASKFAGWQDDDFRRAGIRAVPGAVVRHSAYIAPGVVLMPSFVNVGAHVGTGTMIDTWSTVGSCAHIGAHCHISGGVGIGGVLEPVQANPVIIEDRCFIGARSEVAEGVIVEEGAVLGMGVYLGASTKIIDRASGEVFTGRVPAYAVVVPGSLPGRSLPDGSPGPSLYCAVIVKRVDEKTRARTAINDLLRD